MFRFPDFHNKGLPALVCHKISASVSDGKLCRQRKLELWFSQSIFSNTGNFYIENSIKCLLLEDLNLVEAEVVET